MPRCYGLDSSDWTASVGRGEITPTGIHTYGPTGRGLAEGTQRPLLDITPINKATYYRALGQRVTLLLLLSLSPHMTQQSSTILPTTPPIAAPTAAPPAPPK